MKIQEIIVSNYKAIDQAQLVLNGASVIVTGGNDKGKSSLLKDLIARIQGQKPDLILKTGETNGFNRMELTDGSIIDWNFSEDKETLHYTDSEGSILKRGVLKAISTSIFGENFNIDKFIAASNNKQMIMIQNLLGVDLEDLEKRHGEAFEKRKNAKKDLIVLRGESLEQPLEVVQIDIEALKVEKQTILDKNTSLIKTWQEKDSKDRKEITDFNVIQEDLESKFKPLADIKNNIDLYKDTWVGAFIDFEAIQFTYDSFEKPKKRKVHVMEPQPKQYTLDDIDKKIEGAITSDFEYKNYSERCQNYENWVVKGQDKVKEIEMHQEELDTIVQEKNRIIKESKLPDGFEITSEFFLTYNGYEIDNTQISSSMKYICALKLGMLNLGELKAMHFDASYLDNTNLAKIQKWADENNLQLLIERPDLDAGEITYKIIHEQ